MKIYFCFKEDVKITEIIKSKIDDLCKQLFDGEECILDYKNFDDDSKERHRIKILIFSDTLSNGTADKPIMLRRDVYDVISKNGNSFVDLNDIDVKVYLEKRDIITQNNQINDDNDEFDYEKKAQLFEPTEPNYSFERVIISDEIKEKIIHALAILQCEQKVFKEWGLYEIQPHPNSSLSFYGPSGTGKTMAAEAIANYLGKKILKVSYADVESKYHGEGPKMVKAIFKAAEKQGAVLFFDEADSLLSKRLTNVTQGSEQAINSMRSQLLICLENYKGIVIFATNLVINYDKAFLTRLISIEFVLPDKDTRKKIWDVHIRPVQDGKKHLLNVPLDEDVDTLLLAEKYAFSGREIRNAVISACVNAAMANKDIVSQEDFIKAADNIEKEMNELHNAKDYTKENQGNSLLMEAIESSMHEKEEKANVS